MGVTPYYPETFTRHHSRKTYNFFEVEKTLTLKIRMTGSLSLRRALSPISQF